MSIPYSGGLNIHNEFDAYGQAALIDNLKAQLVLANWTSAGVRAYSTLTLGANPANNQTVTIDGVVYTYKTTINNANPREVLIDTTKELSLANLYHCINDTGRAKGPNTPARPRLTPPARRSIPLGVPP
jgi:hypothetical protein